MMAYPFSYVLSYMAHLVMWGFLLRRGRRHGMLRVYPVFFLFVVISFLGHTSRMIVPYFLDTGSLAYYWFYLATLLPSLALQTVLLFRIYDIVRRDEKRYLWHLLGTAIIVVAWQASAVVKVSLQIRIINSILFFQMVLCAVIVWRLILTHRDFRLGKNWTSIFLGIAIPDSFIGLSSAAFIFEDWWPYSLYSILIEPMALLGWLIICIGMREPDEPSPRPIRK